MTETTTEPTTETTWKGATTPVGMGQTMPACSGGALSLRINLAPDRPIDADAPGLHAELQRNVAARIRDDGAVLALRRLRAQRTAALIRESEARATIGSLQEKREAALEAAGDDLAEVLIELDRETRAAEAVLSKAAEAVKVLERPIAQASEAASNAARSATQTSARGMASALLARQDELLARLCAGSKGTLDELSRIRQRLAILEDGNAGTATVRSLMQA